MESARALVGHEIRVGGREVDGDAKAGRGWRRGESEREGRSGGVGEDRTPEEGLRFEEFVRFGDSGARRGRRGHVAGGFTASRGEWQLALDWAEMEASVSRSWTRLGRQREARSSGATWCRKQARIARARLGSSSPGLERAMLRRFPRGGVFRSSSGLPCLSAVQNRGWVAGGSGRGRPPPACLEQGQATAKTPRCLEPVGLTRLDSTTLFAAGALETARGRPKPR